MRIIGWVVLMLAGGVLVGCTAQSKMVSLRPLDTDLRPYTSMVVSVEPLVTEDVEKEIAALESLIVAKVEEVGVFEDVQVGSAEDSTEGTLLVKVTITEIKKVSEGQRFWLGAFAGRATMTTEVLFMVAVSRQTLGSYSITGESGGTGFSGGTGHAIDKTATGIADVIAKNYRR
ncbi:MAG: DUF4410 domain-containing protein [Candidatus Latescibacteria bacterium]|nr:DUF4410 domain-containing protein [Candidatus Latescibacterota bacterium]NIO29007.1 DUF4410 domain-containing protein [Candidatus Latescibacterota bacterium]NIO56632.1 DUF4410 domain-containing protein [Candidatus Latescibacterota bacterium]NIT02216.1 DUF4410 domain-containing protein [Candidatus Latescibacterota bacterium]NIT39101.1 DUF4410 domain-containing protein [Candidatus Latescibacterota bacterium]